MVEQYFNPDAGTALRLVRPTLMIGQMMCDPFSGVKSPESQSGMGRGRTWKQEIWPARDRIDFFSNHGRLIDGYKQYLSSPYTRVPYTRVEP